VRYEHIQKNYTQNMVLCTTTKKQKKRQDEIMNDKAASLKRSKLTRNNLFIEERTQITPHKPRYSETIKYSL